MRYLRLLMLALLAACSSNGSHTFPGAPVPTLDGIPNGSASTIFLSETAGAVAFATTPYMAWSVISSSTYSLTSLIPIAPRRTLQGRTGTECS